MRERVATTSGESAIKNAKQCIKCNSPRIGRGVDVLDRGGKGAQYHLNLVSFEHKDAWLFRGQGHHRLAAWVCWDCGYTELYVVGEDKKWDTL